MNKPIIPRLESFHTNSAEKHRNKSRDNKRYGHHNMTNNEVSKELCFKYEGFTGSRNKAVIKWKDLYASDRVAQGLTGEAACRTF